MVTPNKLTLGDQLRTLQAGIKANLSDVQSIIIGGTTYTPTTLSAQIDTFLAAQTDTLNATNAFHASVAAEKVSNAAALTFRSQVEGYVVGRYGKANPIVAQFSYTPTKPKKTTTAIKAVAVLKLRATRNARNTLGKVQKKDIKGAVDPSIAASLAKTAGTPAPAEVSAATEMSVVAASAPVASSPSASPMVHAPVATEVKPQ